MCELQTKTSLLDTADIITKLLVKCGAVSVLAALGVAADGVDTAHAAFDGV